MTPAILTGTVFGLLQSFGLGLDLVKSKENCAQNMTTQSVEFYVSVFTKIIRLPG